MISGDDDIIRISEDDLQAVEQNTDLQIAMSDLAPQAEIASGASKPGQTTISWTPQSAKASKTAVDIILLIDTSGSMSASDYPPSRLEAAKQAAKLFTRRKIMQGYSDQVGIIGFGGSPTTYHQLDSNLDSVGASIDKIQITHSGTYIGLALKAAAKQLLTSSNPKRAIVLLSDGADHYDNSDPVNVAKSLNGIPIFTIGVGTKSGGVAQLPHGSQKVQLNEQILRQIAQVSSGQYLEAPDVPQMQRIYAKLADY